MTTDQLLRDYEREALHQYRDHENAPQGATGGFLARIDWRIIYPLATLAIIAVCGVFHLIAIYQSTTPFHSVMPVYGLVACIAYGLICYAVPKNSLIRLLFVAGALTTFWIQ